MLWARVVNTAEVVTKYEIGRAIVEEMQDGAERAAYGKRVLQGVSNILTESLGDGWSVETLTLCRKFYTTYCSKIVNSVYEIAKTNSVNTEMLRFYWSLGRDIVNLKAEARWGNKFLKTLSADLRKANPDTSSFSETNLKYMKYFYEMYQDAIEICPQDEDKSSTAICPQLGDKIIEDIVSVSWGHQCISTICAPQTSVQLIL